MAAKKTANDEYLEIEKGVSTTSDYLNTIVPKNNMTINNLTKILSSDHASSL